MSTHMAESRAVSSLSPVNTNIPKGRARACTSCRQVKVPSLLHTCEDFLSDFRLSEIVMIGSYGAMRKRLSHQRVRDVRLKGLGANSTRISNGSLRNGMTARPQDHPSKSQSSGYHIASTKFEHCQGSTNLVFTDSWRRFPIDSATFRDH